MSRKISNYFQVKPKENASKNVVLASSSTGTSEDVQDGDSDAKMKEHHNRVDEKSNKKGDPAGSKAGTAVTLNGPNQPKNFTFPKKDYGKQSRSFQSSWFKDYSWLHYDEVSDSAFCYICISQNDKGNLTTARNKEQTFNSTGFSNWKKTLSRFKEDQMSECHKLAVDFEVVQKTWGDVVDLTNKIAKETKAINRRCFAIIIESLQFLARQGILIRGDNDEESNFIQLLRLRAKDNQDLLSWLNGKGPKYTSHDIQNEIISLLATHTIRELAAKVKNNYYSLICDGYTDISNSQQLTLCFRWIDDNLRAHEDFVGFYQIQDIKAETITSVINDALIRLQLSLNECRGQCYDGAANMLGKNSGVAQQILALQPKAFVSHCHAHSLRLGVKTIVKNCKLLCDTMGTARKLVTLIKYSPKRETILGVKDNIEEGNSNEEKRAGILKLCPTRWTVTAACYDRILLNYASLLKAWEVCLEERLDPDIRARIIGCDSQMKSFNFFFGLHLSKCLFTHTDNFSRTLQSLSLSSAAGQRLADLTVETLQSIRNKESFDAFYDVVLIKVKEHPVIDEPTVPRKRAPTRYEMGDAQPAYPATAHDHYKKIYFEVVDHLISAIKKRFNQPAFKVYASLKMLLLKAAKGEDISKEIEDLTLKFSTDVNVNFLTAQLCTFRVLVKDEELKCFQDILNVVTKLQKNEQQLIDQVITVCKLIHVNPATSATEERSFSTARRIKTWQRSQMQQSRFNHLSILKTHKERLDRLCLVSVANFFASLNDNRRRNFGQFTKEDFQR